MFIYVVRHAQSRAQTRVNGSNEKEPLVFPEFEEYDTYDPALSAHGRKQAELVARRLSQIQFDAIFSGPLYRQIETAHSIARYQNNKKIQVLTELVEISDEKDPRLPEDLYSKAFPDAEVIPCPDPTPAGGSYAIPDEEIGHGNEIARAVRVERFLTKTFGNDAKILLVSSAMFTGHCLITALLRAPEESAAYEIENTSVSMIHLKDDGIHSTCGFQNDWAHLVYPDEDFLPNLKFGYEL